MGLVLNPSKCEWSWLDPECKEPCPIVLEDKPESEQVKFIPYAEIQMLEVPLGSDMFVANFVENKLLGRLNVTIDSLCEFEDTQAASYLLRVSYSIVRAVHFMRTTPLKQWQKQAEKFDEMMHTAIEKIIGAPMRGPAFIQACLTPRLGGLGLRKTEEHADLAYSASWHESQKTAKEKWTRPENVNETYTAQKAASYKFDETMLEHLASTADAREAQRLRRCAQPHANGFLTAVPSDEEGKDTVMRPINFRTAVKYRLGIPVLSKEILCPLCMQPINIYGDHAVCCAKSGDRIGRHNSLRNLLSNFASLGQLSPILEKKGILGPTSGRRPGDVTLMNWTGNKGLAIDVAVISPLIQNRLSLVDPCTDYAVTQKHGKYDKSFENKDFFFAAVVWETFGAINKEGEEVVRQILRFAAQQLGREFSSYCGRAWARISCNLQTSIAAEILTRISGQVPQHSVH